MDQIDETVIERADEEASAPSPSPASSAAPSRTLRLVVTLQPLEHGYRALLAVGADDCDPLLQRVEVDGWPALADALHNLTDAAAIRWRDQPRNPTVTPPPPSPKRTREPAAGASSNAPAAGDDGTDPAAEDDQAPSGQLTLFDPGG